MALVLKDRVRVTSSTTGTGTFTLGSAASGFQDFSVIGNGNTTYYTIQNSVDNTWEVGIGTYTASGTTLSRDTVLESSNSGSLVNFAAGTKDVFVTYPAEKGLYLDASNNAIGLGTPASATLTNATGLPLTTGVTGTLPVANGGTGVTTSTGTGNVVLSTSPTLTTPLLGTPTSGTLTNCTGLPISTGVSGLGTGVATFLGTPSSSNLASAVTGETGSGALVFATSPTLVTPVLGTPSSGTLTSCTGLPLTTGVTGTLPVTNGGTGQTTANAAFNALAPSQTLNTGKYLTTNGTDTSWATVTQTTFNAGTTGFTPNTATSGTVTLAGTLNVANGGTGQTTAQGAINTLAGATTSGQYLRGNGTNVVMSAIQVADVPTLNQNTTGTAGGLSSTLPVANGGTGLTTYTQGDILYASATGTLSKIADVATGNAIISGGVGADPTYGKIGLTTHVSGTLPVANGGTGQTTYTDGQLLIGNTTGNTLTKATLTAGTGISVTNGAGSITIANTITGAPTTQTYDTGTGATWTKPSSANWVQIEMWGGGGSGGKGVATDVGAGGGGGGYNSIVVAFSDLQGTVTYTVASGGTAVTAAATNGNTGGTTSVTLGTYKGGGNITLSAFGGGGGCASGGFYSGGGGGSQASAGSVGGSSGGSAGIGYDSNGTGGNEAQNGRAAYYNGGGGGGASSTATGTNGSGGNSIYGGGGGGAGAEDNAPGPGAGGASTFGGAGGAGAFDANTATSGTQPAGGGGGSETGTSGAGGAGRVRFTYW